MLDAPPPVQRDTSLPLITHEELRSRYDQPPLPLPPLARWSRLAPFLRRALGQVIPGLRIDSRALERRIARGLPLTTLPRMPRTTWSPHAVVMRDHAWKEMSPFRSDVEDLLARLGRERGTSGLTVMDLDGPPPPRLFRRISSGVPVLVLSTLDQYGGDSFRMAAWAAFATWLAARRQPFQVLTPCPRRLWKPLVAAAWPMAVWDQQARLPRRLKPRAPLPSHAAADAATASLLDLLAPATFVEPALLRSTRLLLGHQADVGCEWQAWFHPLGWASSHSFGMVSPRISGSTEAQATRLENRRNLPPSSILARSVDQLITRQHQRHSPLIALEAQMRSACSCAGVAEAMATVLPLLQRIIARLQQMADAPGSSVDQNSNIGSWFVDMVDRIPSVLRADPVLRRLIGEGLGLAHRFLQSEHVTWPSGVDTGAAQKAMDAHGAAFPGMLAWRLSWAPWPAHEPHRDKNLLRLPSAAPATIRELPLGVFHASHRPLHVSTWESNGEKRESTLLLSTFEEPLSAPPSQGIRPVSLKSNLQRLAFRAAPRPPWARRMWYDRYGLAAEFRIREVPFVLRWIPPGRFTMGSPDGEPGRYDDEGPQHEVCISRGYWLGETPVTQAQWRAVVEAGTAKPGLLARLFGKGRKAALKAAPSHFTGPPQIKDSLPVESVDWTESADFCQLLSSMVSPELSFTLPTEAQWEYACRADTVTALYSGEIKITGQNNAPALDEIAWYGGNSGWDLEVSNPHDSKDWPEKQYDLAQTGTHRVKLKHANPWGLYDMLGNVWEWCQDGQRSYLRSSEIDPLGPMDKSANRVVRGGSWDFHARHCRSAYRLGFEPGYRAQDLGFRLAAGQELGGGAAGRGAPSAGEAEPSPEGRRQSRAAGEIF